MTNFFPPDLLLFNAGQPCSAKDIIGAFSCHGGLCCNEAREAQGQIRLITAQKEIKTFYGKNTRSR